MVNSQHLSIIVIKKKGVYLFDKPQDFVLNVEGAHEMVTEETPKVHVKLQAANLHALKWVH